MWDWIIRILFGWWVGARQHKADQAAEQENAVLKQENDNAKAREQAESHVIQLPDAPTTRVGSAAERTAVGELLDKWSRKD